MTLGHLCTYQLSELEQPVSRCGTTVFPVCLGVAIHRLLCLPATKPARYGGQQRPGTRHRPLMYPPVHGEQSPLYVPLRRLRPLEDPTPARDSALRRFQRDVPPQAADTRLFQPRTAVDRCVSVPPWRRLGVKRARGPHGHQAASVGCVVAHPPKTHHPDFLSEPPVTDPLTAHRSSSVPWWRSTSRWSAPTELQLLPAGCHVAVKWRCSPRRKTVNFSPYTVLYLSGKIKWPIRENCNYTIIKSRKSLLSEIWPQWLILVILKSQ